MQIITRVAPRDFNLFLAGDCHVGAKLFYRRGFDKMTGMLFAENWGCENNLISLHGDLIEAITVDDIRFSFELLDKEKSTPATQMEACTEMCRPFKEKIVVALLGNHEEKLLKFSNLVEERFCRELGVPYGTFSAVVKFVDDNGEQMFKHYLAHGKPSINNNNPNLVVREANLKKRIRDVLSPMMGDCELMSMGHTHKCIVCGPQDELYLTSDDVDITQHYTVKPPNVGYIPPDMRYYCNTGSFLRNLAIGASSYSERAMYKPVELGFGVALIRGGRLVGIEKVVI